MSNIKVNDIIQFKRKYECINCEIDYKMCKNYLIQSKKSYCYLDIIFKINKGFKGIIKEINNKFISVKMINEVNNINYFIDNYDEFKDNERDIVYLYFNNYPINYNPYCYIEKIKS